MAVPFLAGAAEITPSPTRDRRVVARWTLSGGPYGVASWNGLLYVGLREPQSVVAVDPVKGAIVREVVLDREEIASTKDFVSMRVDRANERLLIAQGTDESVSILSLPELAILREIGLEGEVIRDVLPDPKGRYVFILGRSVHVRDAGGDRELRTFQALDPTAIAVSSDGSLLAIVGSQEVGNGRATMVSFVDLATLEEIRTDPLQTDRRIEAAVFAADDQALLVLASDWLAEKSVAPPASRGMRKDARGVHVSIGAADLVSSERICLPENAGAQIAAVAPAGDLVWFAERRCSISGSTLAAPRRIRTASVYGVDALALAYHEGGALAVTGADGSLTLYEPPSPKSAGRQK
ncbi:MAG: YncE family protein [Thermoanaerobaculia bacterium]